MRVREAPHPAPLAPTPLNRARVIVALDNFDRILVVLLFYSPPSHISSPFLPQSADTCTQSISNQYLWGLDRLDSASDNVYTYAPCTKGVAPHVFVIDTGVFAHQEVTGRLSSASTCTLDAVAGCCTAATCAAPWSDDYGHGTHCSGTAAGTSVGASKQAVVHAVKVLTASGSGTTSSVAAGCNWVLNYLTANPTVRPALVSMSLGGGASAALDAAAQGLIDAGIPVVVAAGNDNADACLNSPARVAGAITVGASDSGSARASFSNYGSCVDLFAPGVNIYSSLNAAGSYAVWSGTSECPGCTNLPPRGRARVRTERAASRCAGFMPEGCPCSYSPLAHTHPLPPPLSPPGSAGMATPGVAGVVAQMLSARPCLKPATIASILASTAVAGGLTGLPAGTANRFVNERAAVAAAVASAVC